jgi:hypothetical protein
MFSRLPAVFLLALLLTRCGGPNPSQKALAGLTAEFTRTALSFAPAAATAAGYHRHGKVLLDELLDDYSSAALDRQRLFYSGFRRRLGSSVAPGDLSAEENADLTLLRSRVESELLQLEKIRSYRHEPGIYTGRIREALVHPFRQNYAPWPERARQIVSRLRQIPWLIECARTNLVDSTEIRLNAALEENEENVYLIDDVIREAVPGALAGDYDGAAEAALEALKGFGDFIGRDMPLRGEADWRLPAELYAVVFRQAAGAAAPAEVLTAAEAELAAVEVERAGLLKPAVAKTSTPQAPSGGLLEGVRSALEEARGFLRNQRMTPLPPRDNLDIACDSGLPAEEQARFSPAPPLEPGLRAFLTLPAGPGGEAGVAQAIALRDGVPGRYLQSEFANRVEPLPRRLLRTVFGSREYRDGWPLYASETMWARGVSDGVAEPRAALLEQRAYVAAGTICDIRLHMGGMTGKEALELLRKRARQSPECATRTLLRIQRSPGGFPAERAGWRNWKRARERYRALRGPAFDEREFHSRALGEGAVPLAVLEPVLAEAVAREGK